MFMFAVDLVGRGIRGHGGIYFTFWEREYFWKKNICVYLLCAFKVVKVFEKLLWLKQLRISTAIFYFEKYLQYFQFIKKTPWNIHGI